MNDDIVGWFTTETGQHIPIREGETKAQAMKQYLTGKVDKFKKKKSSNNKIDKDDIKSFVKKGNTYLPVRKGEDKETAIKRYENTFKSREEQEKLDNESRRQKLTNYTRTNKKQIKQMAKEYDDKKVANKVLNNQALTGKEYFGYIAREPKPGDEIIGGGKKGEDITIKNYKKRKGK